MISLKGGYFCFDSRLNRSTPGVQFVVTSLVEWYLNKIELRVSLQFLFPVAAARNCFDKVLLNLSTSLLLPGQYGNDFLCAIPLDFKYCSNSFDIKFEALFAFIVLGQPCLVNVMSK